VVVLLLVVVVDPGAEEPESQLEALLSTWVQVWLRMVGVVSTVVVVKVLVGVPFGTLSQQPL